MLYGALPEDLGLIDISPVEMMCWMYCPVFTPTADWSIPANLEQFRPIVEAVILREGLTALEDGRYVYITAKTLWVSGDYIGNRPGWHSDGFGTDDVNYIWYDRAPTEFIEARASLPTDCDASMDAMAWLAERAEVVTYPNKHLLRLTPAVIHRSPVNFEAGMRTFVKVSISKDIYNLEGNSINHELGENWLLVPRLPERNHPARLINEAASAAHAAQVSQPFRDAPLPPSGVRDETDTHD